MSENVSSLAYSTLLNARRGFLPRPTDTRGDPGRIEATMERNCEPVRLLTRDEVAALLHAIPNTLANWHSAGGASLWQTLVAMTLSAGASPTARRPCRGRRVV
jgi:hypothetical protein